MRFPFGTVSAQHHPDHRILTDFDTMEGILFRVKVISKMDPLGMLLAEADQIIPRKPDDDDQKRTPLLPVVPDGSLGHQVWRVQFDGSQTLLLINSSLGDWHAMSRDQAFVSLVYPAVLREILLPRILIIDEVPGFR